MGAGRGREARAGRRAIPRSSATLRAYLSPPPSPPRSFVFDYETLSRQKLNDRMTYPLLLDLNGYVTVDAGASVTAALNSPVSDTL